MANRTITLYYRKIIDATATKPRDKLVFEDSYTEFKMQAQLYNQEKNTVRLPNYYNTPRASKNCPLKAFQLLQPRHSQL